MGSGLGSAASGIGSGLGSLGSTIGAGASELAGSLGSLVGGGGEAGMLSGLGQSVPAGVEMVGPSAALTGGEAGALFPQALNVGSSAVPQSFAMSAPQSSGGWSQMLGQILSGQGGGGGDSNMPSGPGQQFNIMDTLSPQNIMQGLMNPASGLTKGAPPPPQLSLPAPNVPQTQPDDRLAFLRAFNSTF